MEPLASRKRVVMTACTLLAATCVLVAGCSSGSSAATPQATATADVGYYGAMPEPSVSMPNITLTDTSGQPYNLQNQTKGYVTLLYTGYTNCPDVCPATMAELAGVLKQLPPNVAQRVKVIFISVDPNRDTTTVIRNWLDKFSSKFIGLRAAPDTVATVEKDLDLPLAYDQPSGQAGDYGVVHSAVVFAFDQKGVAHLEYPEGFTIANYVHDVTALVEHGFVPPATGAGTAQ